MKITGLPTIRQLGYAAVASVVILFMVRFALGFDEQKAAAIDFAKNSAELSNVLGEPVADVTVNRFRFYQGSDMSPGYKRYLLILKGKSKSLEVWVKMTQVGDTEIWEPSFTIKN